MGSAEIILTAKTAHTVEFYAPGGDRLAGLDMPASVHELTLSPDGRKAYGSVYGGGTFGRNQDPDHRIVVIDLASRSVEGFIDTGMHLAPHGLMFAADGLLWVTAEIDKALVGVDVTAQRAVCEVKTGGAAHWLAVDPKGERLYLSNKTSTALGVVDLIRREPVGQVDIPGGCEGLAMSADGQRLYVACHETAQLHLVDTRSARVIRSVRVAGAAGRGGQLRRVRLTPDERWLLMSSHQDGETAVFSLPELRQTALVEVGKGPMGFAFPAKADEALVCLHDEGRAAVLDLKAGAITSSFATGAGCEYAQYFART